jgi:polyphosphate kinase 2
MNITSSEKFCDGKYPYKKHLKDKAYEKQKQALQVELLKAQNWAKQTDHRIVALFEGRDAAGKGGTIKRFMEHLNPRGARVVALEKPTNIEKHQWYFQRYVRHLPTAGEIVLFDRSWYNRAGVEKVMGFCTDAQYDEFLLRAPDFERMLVSSGIILFKFWFSVTQKEQARRFDSRQKDPLKQWKVSPIDIAARTQWDEYTEAREAMLLHTNTGDNLWTLIKSDDKKRARLNCMRYFLRRLDYPDKDLDVVTVPDPLVVCNPPPAA